MPNLATIVRRVFLHQWLAYWRKAGSDPYGKPVYDGQNPGDSAPPPPVPLQCRWEDKQQELLLPDDRKVMSRGYVLLTDPVTVGSWVFLLTALPPNPPPVGYIPPDWQALPEFPSIPTVLHGGREILIVKTTPDVRASSYIYEAWF